MCACVLKNGNELTKLRLNGVCGTDQVQGPSRQILSGAWRCTSYLSQVQGNVHLVVLGAAGQRGALPPPLRAINGVGDGVGAVAVALAADVTVLALRKKKKTG